MLAHALALAVGLGSLTLYMAAFFFPEVHRKHDFFWSGLGMFYALVLWACTEQMTGAVLLGQVASVTLLGYLGWQTLVLRRDRTPLDLQTTATAESWQGFREEVSTLTQDFLSQTPLGRILGIKRPARSPFQAAGKTKIRASSVKDVGYEFLDDVEEELEPLRPTRAPSPQPVGAPAPAARTAANSPAPASTDAPAQAPRPRPRSAATAANGSAPAPRSAQSKGKKAAKTPSTPGQAAAAAGGLKGWLGGLAGSFSRPKPSRPVIEIPPREPSVPLPRKKRAAQQESPDLAAKAPDLDGDTPRNDDSQPAAVSTSSLEATQESAVESPEKVLPAIATEATEATAQPAVAPSLEVSDLPDEAAETQAEPANSPETSSVNQEEEEDNSEPWI